MNISAVVVTFNRKAMLLQTLEGIKAQTLPPDRIFLIDNASSDGTQDALREAGFLDWPALEYVRLEQNTGGAGGVAEGMRRALDAGSDWVWTMDDDVVPDREALERLTSYQNISECINSRKVFAETGETQDWEQFFDFATGRLVDLRNVSFANGKSWCPVNVACFEGMLVSRNVIEKISPPDPGYFIYHDDTLFGILASFHTNVIYVQDAFFTKLIHGYGATTPMRCYYKIRNTIKMRRDVYATGMVGKTSLPQDFLFFVNLARETLKALIEEPRPGIAKSLLKGWIDGIRNV